MTEFTANLPPELAEVATRCCVEIHGDGPEQVQVMVDDLCHYPAASWDWLTSRFQAQLSPLPATPADPAITCGTCLHSRPTQHPAILRCAAGVQSGLPTAGRWHTDRHGCHEFIDRTGAIRKPVVTTRDTTPPKTRDFSYDPFTD